MRGEAEVGPEKKAPYPEKESPGNLWDLWLENEGANLLANRKSGRLDQHSLSQAPPSIKFQLTTSPREL